ncbi:eCIS core domain-containing protein [Taibaiella soli]|uniref:eCIS core domain-containing protein n=1 Tax=Taibaiella soli TaxID=1649169 RepID=A0A2W2AIG9_9BACT|nr:DUF4157 domain-containing protein [Taibaiella soli]PZF73382.1 hypothetical protein DN068_08300 [Taibaiella soli]
MTKHDNSNANNQPSAPAAFLQTKLTVGAVNDPMETEADEMADKVMRMPETNFVQRKCAHCEEEEKAQRKQLPSFLQRKEVSAAGGAASDKVNSGVQTSKGNGDRMDSDTKSFMERGFGADFDSVNIHTDGKATEMNTELQARAFTVGNDIYFNQGQYQPGSSDGKRLLAHELTHTMQQGNVARRDMPKDPYGRPLGFVSTPEQEAYDRDTADIKKQWEDALQRLDKGELDDNDLSNTRLRNRMTGLTTAEVTALITKIRQWQTTHPKIHTSKIIEWLEVRKVISTPMQDGATVKRNASNAVESYSMTINGVLIRVVQDSTSTKGNETSPATNFSQSLHWKANASTGVLTELKNDAGVNVNPRQIVVTIKTVYKGDVDAPSAYGKGTTKEDVEEKTTTLRAHEGQHGTDFIDYIRNNKPPADLSRGLVNVLTHDDLDAIIQYTNEISKASCELTDQIGTTQDEFLATPEGQSSGITSCRNNP